MPAAALRRGRLCWAEGAKVLDGNGWLAEELRDCFGSVHADGAAAAAAALLTVVVVVVVVGEGDAAAAHWWVGGDAKCAQREWCKLWVRVRGGRGQLAAASEWVEKPQAAAAEGRSRQQPVEAAGSGQ